ncbi:MAG: DUF805 domain-containing protein [Selenomonadaceae bacterium]|nr:DUF805 domain-containing protein [Selenomonadaceae bacterium]
MARFCSHCGAELNEGGNFCPNCGKEILAKNFPAQTQASASSSRQKIFTLKGRLNRWPYFKYSLILLLPMIVAAIVFALIATIFGKSTDSSLIFGVGLASVLLVACFLIYIVGGVMIIVRRLHDLNLSGWWLIPYYVLIGFGNMQVKDTDSGLFMFSATCGLIAFVCSMFLLFKRGTVGDNKYGADPLENQS